MADIEMNSVAATNERIDALRSEVNSGNLSAQERAETEKLIGALIHERAQTLRNVHRSADWSR